MAIIEKRNANLMNLIKRMHGVVENADIEKHRQSQNHFGALLGNSKDVLIEDVRISDHSSEGDILQGEWVYVNRAHMKKYVILYCHGGGYSTGSRIYARTLTSKLAMSTSMDWLLYTAPTPRDRQRSRMPSSA